ncbi:MAG: DUF4340 domain-containing protein [Anaerolineae bacterium]|nr:DUF4340 domain-containing protein [Anaerolineae bacterium]
MTRWQQILAVILIIQIGLVGFIFWPQSSVQGSGEPLLPGFSAANVISLTLQGSDGERIVLAKDGEAWVLPEAGNYPANGEQIVSFLKKFEGVQTNRLVTETEASHKRLKVAPDDFNRMLEVTMQDGSQRQIYIGDAASPAATHIRTGDRPEVYLTGEVQAYELDPRASNWINTQYYSVPISETVTLTLQNANGTFEFEREGENWIMQGLAADEVFLENNLKTVLNQVNLLQMTRPAGKEEKPSFGLDDPRAIVTLKTVDGKEYTLRIGGQDEVSQEYLVKWSESPYYVWLAQYTASSLIEKTREDFLQMPTPTAEGENDSGGGGQ